MALSEFELKRIDKLVGTFLEHKRPPPEIRDKLDMGYRVDGQSILLFEIRPRWDDPATKMENPIAKATYVKSKKIWKLFWMRADMKWHGYKPFPSSSSLEQILATIDEDQHSCFWG